MRLGTSEEVGRALAAAGRPGPWEVRSVPDLGPRVARCRSAAGDDLLVRFVDEGPDRCPERAAAAHARFPALVPPSLVLRHGLPTPALAQPAPRGRPAAALPPADRARAVGAALARLQRLDAGPRGLGTTLVATAPRWSAEVVTGAARDLAAARAAGADLGARSDALLGMVEARADALDAGSRGVLVHGLLTPATVWVDGDAAVALGFEAAAIGDPEQDLAPLLFVPGFADVAAAYGEGALDAAAVGRLEAHAARFLLGRLAADPDPAKLERVSACAERLLAGEAREHRRSSDGDPAPERILARAALRALAGRPDPVWAGPLHGALACALLAHRHPAAAPGLVRLGLALVAAVPPCRERPDLRPVDDEREREVRAVTALASDPPAGQPLAARWLVDAATALLGAAPASLPRALARHVDGLLASRATVPPAADADAEHVRRLVHHLLALPARPISRADVVAAAGALRLPSLADEGVDGAAAPAVASLADRPALEGAARALPVALLALELGGGDLDRHVPAPALAALLR